MPRQTSTQDLHLRLQMNPGTLAHRIANATIEAISRDEICEGEAAPSTRSLAAQLRVSRSAVVAAYEELVASGFFIAKAGAATWVAPGAQDAARRESVPVAREDGRDLKTSDVVPVKTMAPERVGTSRGEAGVRFDLRPGYSDSTLIDQKEWLRAARLGAQRLFDTRAAVGGLSSTPRFGELHSLIAEHVRVRRGLVCDPADIFFFPSVDTALGTVGRVLNFSSDVVAMENPGYGWARTAFERSGAAIHGVDVDDDGLMVHQLPARAAAVYVTPAHQFPLGTRLSASRRADLLRWVADTDSYVIEDDYDGEFRYDVVPMKPMRAMAGGDRRVFYLGTSSKALSRDMRVSWAIVPPALRRHFLDECRREPDTVSGLSAAILTELLRSRYLLRHSAKAMRTYRARRDRFVSAVQACLPEVQILGVTAGLHVVLAWPHLDDRVLADSLADHGVLVTALSSYYHGPASKRPVRRGLVCGYARLPETRATIVVQIIQDVMTNLSRV